VLDAAVDCLTTLGYANTTAGVVADRAGVSRGAMQYHFRTKGELVIAAVEHLVDRLSTELREVARHLPASEPEDRYSAAIDTLWTSTTAPLSVAWLEISVAARTDPELDSLLVGVRERLSSVIREQTFELFGLDSSHVDARLYIEMTLAMLGGLSVARYTGIGIDRGRSRRERTVLAAWKRATPALLDGDVSISPAVKPR
jgi:AcrR family transcriptional regulator